jgi:hypothetical protein
MHPSVFGALALVSLCLGGPDPADARFGYLFKNPTTGQHAPQDREPYCPQEGDILLFDEHCRFITRVYQCIGTGGPAHAALVFCRPDGTPAIIEAGPHFVQKVVVFEVEPRMHGHGGSILVRRLRTPLTPEQSQALTEFCLAQEGKSYALARLLMQGTPLRARGPVRSYCLGKTCLDRDRWMCSELVVAAMTAAGVLNAKDHPATSFYPRDLCFDEGRHDLSAYYEAPALWYPRPALQYAGSTIRMAPR